MTMTAEQILSTPLARAGALFDGNEKAQRKAYVRLLGQWHPDTCRLPRAQEVFTHLIALRDALGGASAAAADGISLPKDGGGVLRIRPLRRHATDTGELIVLSRTFAQRYDSAFDDLAAVEASVARQFTYADDAMQTQMAPALPRVLRTVPLADGTLVIGQRDPDEVFLVDLVARYGVLDARHAAWICSGLMNTVAYLGYAKRVHGAIGLDTVLVDPVTHSVRLAAGWGFITPMGQRPKALPGRTLDLMPRLAVKGQVVDARVDGELVRQTLREILGDPRGSNGGVAALPGPLRNWLQMPPAKTAAADYAAWHAALVEAWGPRTFVKAPFTAANVYA